MAALSMRPPLLLDPARETSDLVRTKHGARDEVVMRVGRTGGGGAAATPSALAAAVAAGKTVVLETGLHDTEVEHLQVGHV